MKPKHLLTTAAIAIGLSNSACDPIKQNTHEKVDLIMALPQSDKLLVESNTFYDGQPDFESLTGRQQTGKIMLRTFLAQMAEKLQKGEYLQEFCQQVLQSADSPIGNPEVGFKVENDTGVDIKNIVFSTDEWEIFTPGWLFNRILKNPKVTSVKLNWESLEFTVTGEEFSLETWNKHSVVAREEWKQTPTGTVEYVFSVTPKIIDPKTIAAK